MQLQPEVIQEYVKDINDSLSKIDNESIKMEFEVNQLTSLKSSQEEINELKKVSISFKNNYINTIIQLSKAVKELESMDQKLAESLSNGG